MMPSQGNSAKPTVSVLMPVYNTQRYLGAAVESVLRQTFPDFELLALNDGSSDRSLEILKKFEAKDSRVRVLSRHSSPEKRNVSAVRNILVTAAQGRFLANMDSDDISRPDRFAKQVAYLDAHANCVAVGAAAMFIDPDGLPILKVMYELTHEEIDNAQLLGWRSRMFNPSVMMRTDAVIKAGKYDERFRFAGDFDLFLRLAEIGTLANLSEVLVEYRQHLDSITYAHHEEQCKLAGLAVQTACVRRGINVRQRSTSELISQKKSDVYRRWASWALSVGNLNAAGKHAIRALVAEPFNIENLRVLRWFLACAIRGY